MNNKRSNLRLRTNVYLRDPNTTLAEDRDFIGQVRGRQAISRMLDLLGISLSHRRPDEEELHQMIRNGLLSPVQLNALNWEVPCARCGSMPFGETFAGKVEFRCPYSECVSRLAKRSVRVPVCDIQAMRHPANDLIARSIDRNEGRSPSCQLEPPFAQIPVRLDLTMHFRYSDEDLTQFLVSEIRRTLAK